MSDLNGRKVVSAKLHGVIHLGPYHGQVGPTLTKDSLGSIGTLVMTKVPDGILLEAKTKGVAWEVFIPNGNIQGLAFEQEPPKVKK